VKKTLIFLCCVSLCNLTLFAQIGRVFLHTTEKSSMPVPAQEPPAGLKKIYSNLGPKTNLYDAAIDWSVSGPNSPAGTHFFALPFTPKSNSTVEQVGAALQYNGKGANQVNVSIYSDNGGLPGTLLAGPITVTNLPATGTCCALAVADFSPLSVTAGTKYWVVADTPLSGTGSDFRGAWAWIPKPIYLQGENDGDGWYSYDTSPGEAAAEVLGTIP
jgi:hypothetical protein